MLIPVSDFSKNTIATYSLRNVLVREVLDKGCYRYLRLAATRRLFHLSTGHISFVGKPHHELDFYSSSLCLGLPIQPTIHLSAPKFNKTQSSLKVTSLVNLSYLTQKQLEVERW